MKPPALFTAALLAFLLAAASAPLRAQALPSPAGSAPENPRPATPSADEVIVMDEFNINETTRRNEWVSTQALTGTRTAEAISNLPYQIQVLTAEFFDDFAMQSVAEQLSNISGFAAASDEADPAIAASPSSTSAITGGASRLRGFAVLTLRDGFRMTQPPQSSNTQQVEAIKGPMSALYGAIQPGGVINYVSRRPTGKPRYQASLMAGSYDSWNADISINTPLLKRRLYLLASANRNFRKAPIRWVQADTATYYASLLYRPSRTSNLTITWESQHLEGRRSASTPSYYINNTLVDGAAAGQPNWDENSGTLVGLDWDLLRAGISRGGPDEWYNRNYDRLHIQLEQTLGKNWRFKLGYQWQHKWFNQRYYATSDYSRTFGVTKNIQPQVRYEDLDYPYAFVFDLLGNFKTGPVRHALLFTADLMSTQSEDALWRRGANVILPTDVRFMDPYSPNWDTSWFSWDDIYSKDRANGRATLNGSTNIKAVMQGFSVTERMFMFDGRLTLQVSLRHDYSGYSYYRATGAMPVPGDPDFDPQWTEADNRGLSHSYGANYRLLKGDRLILFANNSTSFNPTLTVDQGRGKLMPNETATGYEAGVKILLPGNKFNIVASGFQITKYDIPISNPDYIEGDGSPEYLGEGVQRVKGVDIDLSWFPHPDFTLLAAGSYVDSETVRTSNTRLVGKAMTNVPDKNLSFSAKYKFPGFLAGFSAGVNTTYRAGYVRAYWSPASSASPERAYEWMPSAILWGGFLKYDWRSRKTQQSLALNVRNAFDRVYVGVGSTVRSMGRQVSLTYKITH